jgi:hypothetical protein
MSEYIELPDKLAVSLWNDFMLGPKKETGSRLIEEKLFPSKIENKIKVSIFSNEREPPHFRLEFQGEDCRYDLYTGKSIDNVPHELGRYRKNIKDWFDDNRDKLIKFYMDNLADTAPPQARGK